MVREHCGSVPFALLMSVPSLAAIVQSLLVRALCTPKAYLHLSITGQYVQASGANGGIGFCPWNQHSESF